MEPCCERLAGVERETCAHRATCTGSRSIGVAARACRAAAQTRRTDGRPAGNVVVVGGGPGGRECRHVHRPRWADHGGGRRRQGNYPASVGREPPRVSQRAPLDRIWSTGDVPRPSVLGPRGWRARPTHRVDSGGFSFVPPTVKRSTRRASSCDRQERRSRRGGRCDDGGRDGAVHQIDHRGRRRWGTSVPGIWAAGTAAGVSVHTIVTAGDGARVAINLISEVRGGVTSTTTSCRTSYVRGHTSSASRWPARALASWTRSAPRDALQVLLEEVVAALVSTRHE